MPEIAALFATAKEELIPLDGKNKGKVEKIGIDFLWYFSVVDVPFIVQKPPWHVTLHEPYQKNLFLFSHFFDMIYPIDCSLWKVRMNR